MNSRERIRTALAHREADRVPFDLGGLGPSSISLIAYQNLLAHLRMKETAEVSDLGAQRARPSEDFLKRFRVDTRALGYRPQRSWQLRLQEEDGSSFYFDEWGIGRKKPAVGGYTFFIFHHPLAAVETGDLPRYPWPDPADPGRLEGVEEKARVLRAESDPAFVFGGSLSQGILQFAAQLEGYERFFMNLALDPVRVEWLLDKILELKLQFHQKAAQRLPGTVDVICEMDDFGHQHGPWISREMFRKFVKPRYQKLIATVRREWGAEFMLHSCGAVSSLIPDFIEMGVNILNPIQFGADGMGDTRRLKKEFGDALTFWGGGVDVQKTLPSASPRAVEDEVQRRIEDLAPGGGFVFAATQAIQPDTPPENVLAMLNALERYGGYSV